MSLKLKFKPNHAFLKLSKLKSLPLAGEVEEGCKRLLTVGLGTNIMYPLFKGRAPTKDSYHVCTYVAGFGQGRGGGGGGGEEEEKMSF